jgi:hypothetical protein
MGSGIEKVLGIGGLFFRSRDPKALARWYREHRGVTPVPVNYDEPGWEQQAGPTVFAPFPEDTKYFGDAGKQLMVNFRVRDLDATRVSPDILSALKRAPFPDAMA